MNRRGLLSFIASLPIIGGFVKPADGVALRLVAHPIGPATDGEPGNVVTDKITLTPYAYAGEEVTCENGHLICEFTADVFVGQTQDPPSQLGKWRQPEPAVGAQIPTCAVCGGAFYQAGGVFHFRYGWRTAVLPSLKLRR